jgi:lysophospholipase L1-like esterase
VRPARLALLAVVVLSGRPATGLAAADGATPPLERIIFFGDSLVHRSDGDHGLLALVRGGLEERERGRRFELIEAGHNGDKIADLKKRVNEDVLARRPSAVVLYWDSDVSDVDEGRLSPAQFAAVRAAYESNLSDVLRALVRARAHVIMTGPTLIGEKRRGQNPKDAQLDAYAALNRRMAADSGVRYLDSRHAFFARETAATDGPLTEDGEHLSAAGVRLLAHEVLRALHHWLHREDLARQ